MGHGRTRGGWRNESYETDAKPLERTWPGGRSHRSRAHDPAVSTLGPALMWYRWPPAALVQRLADLGAWFEALHGSVDVSAVVVHDHAGLAPVQVAGDLDADTLQNGGDVD